MFDASLAASLPEHTLFDFEFKLTEDLVKIASPIYPLSLDEEEACEEWVNFMLEKKQIFENPSPICSPLLFVTKSDETLCPCVNYGNLNNVTVPDVHPAPLD